MIRISIFILTFFSFWHPALLRAQDEVIYTCYSLDSISWELSISGCAIPMVDSFHLLTRADQNSDFHLQFSGTDPSIRGYRDDAFKSDQAVMIRYFVHCPDIRTVQSDTLSLALLREAVELDSVRVLANGDVRLVWKAKPVAGVRYTVNAAVAGSSQVLASDLRETSFTDTRGLATRDIVYYSISAALGCGYTFPEPDSFFHTSLLSHELAACGGNISFDFIPFSYWKDGITKSTLMVLRNGLAVDNVDLAIGDISFTYEGLDNHETYTFYIRESGDVSQSAFSNPITINTDYYEPVKWSVIDELTFDDRNQAIIFWTTNDHVRDYPFQLYRNNIAEEIPSADLVFYPEAFRYSYEIPDFAPDQTEYKISLRDSCGNNVESSPKVALITKGRLAGKYTLNLEWTNISDQEWTVNSYDIFYRTNGGFTLLGSVDGSTFDFDHIFDESNPLDSLCYYVVTRGEVEFSDADSTTELNIRSNTVCLYGETVVEFPNAFSSNQSPYKPIIVPGNNISAYVFRVFDRYGNLVFESHNPDQGWDGKHQERRGFMDTYLVQVEFTNTQGEHIYKSGSLLLFP